MATPSDLPIVLYHYEHSPYARRVVWYLNLRGIPYSQCLQPRIMPRPDLELLGVSYRRIPVLSIGRDVYADSRLILEKLEALYPASAAHPGISAASAAAGGGGGGSGSGAERAALEQLLATRAADGGLFMRAVQCFPAAAFADAAFQRDRAALNGIDVDAPGAAPAPLSRAVLARQRPEALAVMRRWVRWLETGLLADGRTWILDSNTTSTAAAVAGGSGGGGGGGPSLADIEAAWVLHWVSGVPGALPADVLGPESAPRVVAWLARFAAAVAAAGRAAPAPAALGGEEAARRIAGSRFAEPEGEVLRTDPTVVVVGGALAKGAPVRLWPTDYGFSHKDSGKLVSVDDREYVIEAEGAFGSIRIHAPRHGFTISADKGGVSPKI
ncbi:putative glutathione s-transferase [Rosellinia necatrix]|uniref:Putative glutathione s-transferase n=1 Tax=Rosellinia necatrix TaxID=77044 RepID=A0A1S7UMJ9_ROSNE|nr:putative glutathione s-transferase [Rosellinia necatrix]